MNTKRILLGLSCLVLAALAIILPACSSTPTATTAGPTGATTKAPTTAATTKAADVKAIKWVYTPYGSSNVNTTAWKLQVSFCDRVNLATGGRLVIEIKQAGSVVPSTKEFEGVKDGTLDMSTGAVYMAQALIPTATLFTFPVGGMDGRGMNAWVNFGGGKALWDEAMSKFDVYSPDTYAAVHTPEIWCFGNKEIKTLADVKGLNMRCAGDAGAALKDLGINTIAMPPGEIYEGLQRKVIDIAESTGPDSIMKSAFYEVAKYFYTSSTRAASDCGFMYINKAKWAALPTDIKEIVAAECAWLGRMDYDGYVYDDMVALTQLKDKGVTLVPMPAEINVATLAAGQKYYAGVAAKDAFFKKVYDSQQNFQKLYDLWNASSTPKMS